MPLQLDWDTQHPHQALRLTGEGELDWLEYGQIMARVDELIGQTQNTVHLLVMVKNLHIPADAPLHFPTVARMALWRRPNMGATIVIGADNFFRLMVDIYQQVYSGQSGRIFTVETLDEAYELLERLPQ